MAATPNKLLLIILCFLLPPLAVFMSTGAVDGTFILNLILTLVGLWVVGVIHALIVVL